MGNVLTKYKLSDYIGTYTEDEAQASLLKNQVCASVEWICMDRGTMTDEEAVRSICKRIPQSEWELVERFVRDGGASGRVEGTGVPFVFDVKYITPFPGIFKKYSVCRVYGRHLDFV
mgnify:CR=1 FL=1